MSNLKEISSKLRAVTHGSPYLSTTYQQDSGLFAPSMKRINFIVLLVVFIAFVPYISSASILSVTNFSLIAIIGAVGLQVVTGMASQLSLGHAAFMATGAFVSTGMFFQMNLPPWLIIPLGAISGMILGFISGIPALRLRGFYLGITTLALQAIVGVACLKYQVFLQTRYGTTTDLLLPQIRAFGVTIESSKSWFFFLLVVSGLSVFFVKNLSRSQFGRDTAAMRQKEVVAESLGINVAMVKLRAFAIAGFFGGLCGTLQTFYFRQASIEDFSLTVSVKYLAMILIGGLGVVSGAVYGAIFVTGATFLVGEIISRGGLTETLGPKSRGIELAVFAMMMIVFLIFEPDGIAGVWTRVKGYFHLWPYRYVSTTRAKR